MNDENHPPADPVPNVQPMRVEWVRPMPPESDPPPVRPVRPYRHPARNFLLPLVLFVLTAGSMFMAQGITLVPQSPVEYLVRVNLHDGLVYMTALMGILLAHEMGHFVQTLLCRVPATLPYFIPMPFSPFGTFGAVISMDAGRATRRDLFDIGISGPLAGLVVAIPVAYYGVKYAVPIPADHVASGNLFYDPLLFTWLIQYLHPELPGNTVFVNNPLYMAGWVGMLITGLNMLPISQLDGGHVAYALFGRGAHWLARGVMLAAAVFIVLYGAYMWTVMFLLVALMGTDHPRTADDTIPIGWGRWLLGLVSLGIPLACLAPIPFSIS